MFPVIIPMYFAPISMPEDEEINSHKGSIAIAINRNSCSSVFRHFGQRVCIDWWNVHGEKMCALVECSKYHWD